MFWTFLELLITILGIVAAIYYLIQWIRKKNKILLLKAVAFFVGTWLLGVIISAVKIYS